MKKFDASFIEEELFGARYVQTAFEYPKWPVIAAEDPGSFRMMRWGLIPSWVKDADSAIKLRSSTVNARAETIREKPSFRRAAINGHCLIPADGFFEFRDYQGKKYPYFIRLRAGKTFALAGLCESWTDPSTGEMIPTFTVLTTQANPMMEVIHNSKKRMPVILSQEKEGLWLSKDPESFGLLKPYPEEQMEAWTVARLLTSRDELRNSQAVQEPFEYPELSGKPDGQQVLF